MAEPPAPRTADAVASVAYRELVARLTERIREAQARAARTVNTELVMLYWSIGRDILEPRRGPRPNLCSRLLHNCRGSTSAL